MSNLSNLIESLKNEPMTKVESMLFDALKDCTEIGEKNSKQIAEIKSSSKDHGRRLDEIRDEYPLLPPEADDLSKEVKRKGVEILGGKKSNAYNDKSIRKKVYMDIYYEIKRAFGLIDEKGFGESYKKLKRKHLAGAFELVKDYEAPAALASEIESMNEMDLED